MDHRTVRHKYVAWGDRRLCEEERRRIQAHLDRCDECRVYYEKMSRMMSELDPALLPRLSADPWAAVRIRAARRSESLPAAASAGGRSKAGAGSQAAGRSRAQGWLRVSFAGIALAIAASAGVLLGRGLSNRAAGESMDIASAYYQAFSPSDVSAVWENVLSEIEGSESGEER